MFVGLARVLFIFIFFLIKLNCVILYFSMFVGLARVLFIFIVFLIKLNCVILYFSFNHMVKTIVSEKNICY